MELRPGAPGARNLPVDGLRGVLALLIVVYHCTSWLGLPMPGWLKVTGLMGVDAFFVISGYALGRVYWHSDWCQLQNWGRYAAKRVLRIAPLLFLATAVAVVPSRLLPVLAILMLLWLALRRNPRVLAWTQALVIAVFLVQVAVRKPDVSLAPTLSLVWAFVDPTLSIAPGSWSIGVELVFYVALPILLYTARKRPAATLWILAGTVALAIGWDVLRDTAERVDGWRNYVAVPHHAFFFAAGIALHAWQHRLPRSPVAWTVMIIVLGVLYVMMAPGTPVGQGWPRAGFALLTMGIVVGVAMLDTLDMSARVTAVLAFLGEISYGVYMLHFGVFSQLHAKASAFQSRWIELGAVVAMTIVAAAVSRIVFEKSFELPGRKRTVSASPQPA